MTRQERLTADRYRIAGILWCHDPLCFGMGGYFPGDRYDGYAEPIQKCRDADQLSAFLRSEGIQSEGLFRALIAYLAIEAEVMA